MVASGGLGAAGTGRAGGNQLLGRGLRLGRIFGVPIRLDFTWFIGLAIFTTLSHDVWSPRLTGPAAVALSVLFTCAFFTSVLAHELSHALAARVLGIGTMEISLLVFGGVARIVSEPADAAGEALMAMAGPLTSVSLAGLLWLCSQLVGGWPGDLLALLGLANLVLAAFNLLPGFPLDGGRVARSPSACSCGTPPARASGPRARSSATPPTTPSPTRRRDRPGGCGQALRGVCPERYCWNQRCGCHHRRGAPVLVTARLRPPDRMVEVADVRRVKDLLARLEVLPTTVLVIRDGALLTSEDELRDGDAVEVRFAISGGAGRALPGRAGGRSGSGEGGA